MAKSSTPVEPSRRERWFPGEGAEPTAFAWGQAARQTLLVLTLGQVALSVAALWWPIILLSASWQVPEYSNVGDRLLWLLVGACAVAALAATSGNGNSRTTLSTRAK